MKWSEQAWQAIEPVYASILEMPFINKLSDGSLRIEKFRFYIQQDACYLEHFSRALSLIAARIDEPGDVHQFIRFAENAIVVENALHASYFKEYGINGRVGPEPACHHYIHFLKSTAALDPVEVAMAAVLPCFWIYQRVGDHIYRNQYTSGNPYTNWIATYAGEEFGAAVSKAIALCDKAVMNTTDQIRQRMTLAFFTAAKLEFDFWDAAYKIRKW